MDHRQGERVRLMCRVGTRAEQGASFADQGGTGIGVLNAIKDTIEIVPAKGAFGSVATILGLIRVGCFVNVFMSSQVLTGTNEIVRTR